MIVSLYLTTEENEKLEKLSKKEGLSKSSFLRNEIEKIYDKSRKKIDHKISREDSSGLSMQGAKNPPDGNQQQANKLVRDSEKSYTKKSNNSKQRG